MQPLQIFSICCDLSRTIQLLRHGISPNNLKNGVYHEFNGKWEREKLEF